jgi:hypothetical protein
VGHQTRPGTPWREIRTLPATGPLVGHNVRYLPVVSGPQRLADRMWSDGTGLREDSFQAVMHDVLTNLLTNRFDLDQPRMYARGRRPRCRVGKRAVLCEKPFAMSGDGYQAMDQRRAIRVLLRP